MSSGSAGTIQLYKEVTMFTKADKGRDCNERSMAVVVHGHKVTMHFTDSPNAGLPDLVKRALLNAYMPMAKQVS